MIDSIRYWGQQDMVPNRHKQQQAWDYTKSFQADLLNSMAGNMSSVSMPSSMQGADISSVPGLMQVNVEGIEKVWAEQLKNPAGYLDFQSSGDKKNNQLGGLGGMLDMSVQVHLLRAKKNLERQKKEIGLDDLLGSTDAGLEQTLQHIRQDLQSVAQKYNLSLTELGRRLDLDV